MLYPGLHIILNFVSVLYFVKGEALIKGNDKSFNRDYQICMDNFVIHMNMIIRTQDSREMGAKYLNEMDVNSRQECKRFCCETDMCDVFIFEEKKPSSCYLFHCGPPHDFKCKFTNHTNYSSAVLTIVNPQNTAQLEEQIHRTQQEHELKLLRKLSDSASLEYPYTESTVELATQMTKIPVLTTPIINKTTCSRNQYECRATKDCIAIYNVCDGIPQCADGSDESADLGCPTEKSTLSPQLLMPKPLLPLLPDIANYQQMMQHHKSYAPMYEHTQEQEHLKSWELPNSIQQIVPQQQNIPYPRERIMLSQPQMNFGSFQRYQWDYPPYYEPNNEPYNNANIPHGQKLSSYEQDQPRIFHHKRPGVISENGERESYVEQSRPYVPYYMPSNHETRQESQHSKIKSQPKVEPEPQPESPSELQQKQIPEPQSSNVPKYVHNQIEKSQKEVKNTTVPPTCNKSIEHISAPVKSNNEAQKFVESLNNAPQISKNKSEKPISTSKDENRQINKQNDEIQHRTVEHNKKIEEKVVPVAEHYRYNEEEDERLRPKGAVISLAFGLIVTAIMAVLIACRLRVVRRRGRRGLEPYAHDADYLVNGMYL